MNEKIKKASRHTSQNEGLIFEKSSPGKRAFELPPLDVPAADPAKALVMTYVRRLVVDGYAEWDVVENGDIQLRFHTGETFLFARTMIIRIA